MIDTLTVLLEGRVAGVITRGRRGTLRFDYDDDYRSVPGRTPLSVSMPTAIATHDERYVRPWLSGLLPDDDAVLRRWAREFQVSASSPFALLSSPVGFDCAGAAQFVAPEQVAELRARAGTITWLRDDEVAARLRDLRADRTAWLGRRFDGHFSLAGAQAKIALVCQDGRWGLPVGAAATTHILKPAIPGMSGQEVDEHLCLAAARIAGLDAARSMVKRFGDETAVVLDRFDRFTGAGGVPRRVHQEDLCQALSVEPGRKYQYDGGPGLAQVGLLLGSVMSAAAAQDVVWRFADALVWNWLIGGTDAHAKNYSLLLSGDQVRLAPLYDLASALPYDESHEHKLRFAMKLGDSYEVYLRRDPWPAVAAALWLDGAALHDRAVALAARAPDAFSAAVTELDGDWGQLPPQLLDLVADRCRRCRALLMH